MKNISGRLILKIVIISLIVLTLACVGVVILRQIGQTMILHHGSTFEPSNFVWNGKEYAFAKVGVNAARASQGKLLGVTKAGFKVYERVGKDSSEEIVVDFSQGESSRRNSIAVLTAIGPNKKEH